MLILRVQWFKMCNKHYCWLKLLINCSTVSELILVCKPLFRKLHRKGRPFNKWEKNYIWANKTGQDQPAKRPQGQNLSFNYNIVYKVSISNVCSANWSWYLFYILSRGLGTDQCSNPENCSKIHHVNTVATEIKEDLNSNLQYVQLQHIKDSLKQRGPQMKIRLLLSLEVKVLTLSFNIQLKELFVSASVVLCHFSHGVM